MNFSNISGYDFEVFIENLFKKLGFKVTRTSYSNDGGVDLIAYYDKPIFKGKYIIQCKNWAGSVGQPEVRDLFGVVMSENANKGILITPSDYSEQAYNFAKGKNIELINGRILDSILAEIEGENKLSQDKPKKGNFNLNMYQYLQENINNDPKDAENYHRLISFSKDYIIKNDHAVVEENIIEKIIECYKLLIEKCYKSASQKHKRICCTYGIAEMELIRGCFSPAIHFLLDNNWLELKCFRGTIGINADGQMCAYYNWEILSRNLYISLKKQNLLNSAIKELFNVPKEIDKTYDTSYPFVSVNFKEQAKKYLVKQSEELLQFNEGKLDDVFYYSTMTSKKYSSSFGGFHTSSISNSFIRYEEQTGSIDYFINNYYSTKSIEDLKSEVVLCFKSHGINVD